MGPAGAARLVEAVNTQPGASAAALLPQAAAANRPIFYRDGRPATVGEVYANLSSKAGQGAPAAGGAIPDSLSPKDRAVADQMDRMRQDQGLLALLLGQDGDQADAGFRRAFVGIADA